MKHIRDIGAVAARVHPESSADAAGNGAQEGQINARLGAAPRDMSVQRGSPCCHGQTVDGDAVKPPPQPDHHTAHTAIAHDQIAADAHREHRNGGIKRRQKGAQIVQIRRLEQHIRRPAHTQPRQIG